MGWRRLQDKSCLARCCPCRLVGLACTTRAGDKAGGAVSHQISNLADQRSIDLYQGRRHGRGLMIGISKYAGTAYGKPQPQTRTFAPERKAVPQSRVAPAIQSLDCIMARVFQLLGHPTVCVVTPRGDTSLDRIQICQRGLSPLRLMIKYHASLQVHYSMSSVLRDLPPACNDYVPARGGLEAVQVHGDMRL